MNKIKSRSKKVLVGIAGGVVVLVGIVAIPYPGPGWLIVFAGLAILSTEYAWAHRILAELRRRYDLWVEWLARQHWTIRLLSLAATAAITITTIWLLNGYGLIDNWLDLNLDWVHGPWSSQSR